MVKLYMFIVLAFGASANAANRISMNVSDLKTGKTEAKLSMPLWVAKTGVSLSKVMGVRDENIDIEKLVAQLETQKQTGAFLVIEDHEENKKITFELE